MHTYTFMRIYKRKPYLQLVALVWLILQVNLNSFKNHWDLGFHYTEIANHCPEGRNSLAVWFSLKHNQNEVSGLVYLQIRKSSAQHWNKIECWSPGSVMVYFLHEVPQQKVAATSQRDGTRQRRIGIDWKNCFYILKSALVWSHSITFIQSTYAFISMFEKKALALAVPQKHWSKEKLIHRST